MDPQRCTRELDPQRIGSCVWCGVQESWTQSALGHACGGTRALDPQRIESCVWCGVQERWTHSALGHACGVVYKSAGLTAHRVMRVVWWYKSAGPTAHWVIRVVWWYKSAGPTGLQRIGSCVWCGGTRALDPQGHSALHHACGVQENWTRSGWGLAYNMAMRPQDDVYASQHLLSGGHLATASLSTAVMGCVMMDIIVSFLERGN